MLKQLLSYIKNPTVVALQRPKVKNFVSLYFINLMFAIPIAIFLNIILEKFSLTDNIKRDMDFNSLKWIIVVVILAPFVEEILFRSLLKFTKQNLILFSTILTAVIALEIFTSSILLASVLSFTLLAILLTTKICSISKVAAFINSRFKYFFYTSAIVFGLLHALNYGGSWYIILLFSFILGGRQIVGGFILGFMRMNYGLIYSILFHMTINTITLLLFVKR